MISNLRYADDIVLIASSEAQLQDLLNCVQQESEVLDLFLHPVKTQVMSVGKKHIPINATLDGVQLKQVERYKYLGAIVNETATCSEEIRMRIGAAKAVANTLVRIWKSSSVSKSTKVRLLRTLVWPVAVYGCETWTIKAAEEQKLRSFELWCYRRVLRVPWTDHRTDDWVLQQLGVQRMFWSHIKNVKLRYFGHLCRRPPDHFERTFMEQRPTGSRCRGRPRRRWCDDIRQWMNMDMNRASHLAQDRQLWRQAVCGVTNPQS
jgi:hypothetical protein